MDSHHDAEAQTENRNLREHSRLPREFCFEDLKTVTNDFPDKLGSGRLGSVFNGVLEDGTPIVVKQVERLLSGEE
ncbi:hypothetical protein GIB67_003121 [Kingdonia uniflora]|uniref:Uncharacterized protein n=1 Tax=Kingdonia uniflora TaxID=39325 RepID=A0A7J7N5Z8_9MAGN|nr:hypothetical protein GIB67_003121 [Kingdonia uniflora]